MYKYININKIHKEQSTKKTHLGLFICLTLLLMKPSEGCLLLLLLLLLLHQLLFVHLLLLLQEALSFLQLLASQFSSFPVLLDGELD